MPDKGGKYAYINLNEADNGYRVTYDISTKNPMEPTSTFGSNQYHYESKDKLFEVKDGMNVEQALDAALALMKTLYMSNKANSNTEHNSDHKV